MKTSTKFSFDGTIQELKALLDQGLFNERMRISFEAGVMIFEEVQEPSPEDVPGGLAQLEIQFVDAPVNAEVNRKPEKEKPPVSISGDSAILVKSLCTFLGVAPETDSRFDLIDVIEDVLYLLPNFLPEGGSISVKATAKTLRDRLRHAGFNLSPSRSKNFVEDYIFPYLRGTPRS